MRVPINLASRPLENLRPVRAGVAVAALAALLLGIILLRNEMSSRSEFSALIEERAALQRSLAGLRSEQEELESWLSTPQSEQIRQRSAFLNSLILRKSLSWTQMFMDLEAILPQQARIVSIKPSLSAGRDVDLTLTAAASSMGPLVELVKRLEDSPKFGAPSIAAQKSPSPSSDAGLALDLTTRYRQDQLAAPDQDGNSAGDASAAETSEDADGAEVVLEEEAAQ